MASSEKFCLRWNDFETNISVAFRELREEKDFFDVTLACDDSQIQAHKVILSACSPFFRNVLRRNPHQHPLLYLKGVKYKDILSVLNFMYMGEVNVAQEELNTFLSVAEDLRVKGLTQNNSSSESQASQDSKHDTPKNVIRPRDTPDSVAPPPKRPRPPAPAPHLSGPVQSFRGEDDDIQEVVPVKSEPRDPAPLPVAPVEQPQVYHHNTQEQVMDEQGTVALDDYADETYDYGQYEGYDDGTGMLDTSGMAMGAADGNKDLRSEEAIDEQIQSRIIVIGRSEFQCAECGQLASLKPNMWKHIEAKHMAPQPAPCMYCNKLCPSKNALASHVSRYHRAEKKF